MVKWKYSDADTMYDCGDQSQLIDHLLKCHMLSQECTSEDLMGYNEACEGVCLSVDEQCVATRQEEDRLYIFFILTDSKTRDNSSNV